MASSLDFKSIRPNAIEAWSLAHQRLGESHTETLQKIIIWVCGNQSALNAMLRGEGIKPSTRSSHIFIKPLLAYLNNDRVELDKWLTVLRQVIQAGNELLHWGFPLPALTIRAPREKGRFNPQRFHNRIFADKWRESLFQSFDDSSERDAQYHLGQILLSALLCGGLINTQLLIALSRTITEEPKYHLKKRYFDLTPTWQGHEDVEFRRWFPDPITESLLLRYQHLITQADLIPKLPSGKWILNVIYRFLRLQKLAVEFCPSSVSSLIDSALIRYELNLSPFLVQYAARKHLSHSLRASAWSRLKNTNTAENKSRFENELELTSWEKYPAIESEQTAESSALLDDHFADLRSILKEDHVEPARKGLTAYLRGTIQNDGQIRFLIVHWFVSLLDPPTGSKSVQTSTLRNYLSTIGKRLYEVFPDMDLRQLSTEEIEEKYQLILDDIDSKGLRRKVAKALYHFHKFISDRFHIEAIDYHAVLGAFSAPAPVDANVLWVDEYYRTLELIQDSELIQMHPDMVEVAQLIMMLGYRCGLRRMEALKLRIMDVVGKIKPVILVRPFDERRLKTTNSKRAIPLLALLSEQELKQLLAWRDKRISDENAQPFSEYLFAVPELNYSCVSEDLIFPILHSAMRTSTGDNSLRFHHLRHSFGSLTLLRLMSADHGVPQGYFDNLPLQRAELENAHVLRNNLLPILGPTRKHLYAVAKLLGHSGPDISLEHYLHVLDVLLHHQMAKTSKVPAPMLVAASGLPTATAYRQLADSKEALLTAIRKRHQQLPAKEKQLPKTTKKVSIDKVNIDAVILKEFDTNWKILYLHSAFNISAAQLAERYKRTEDDVLKLIKSAQKLQEEKTAGPNPAPKFPMQIKKLPDGNSIQLLCPSKPRTEKDKALAEQLILGAHRLKLSDPELYQKGLQLYQQHTWRTRYHVVFKNAEDANLFLKFLEGLGLAKHQIQLTLLHGQKASESWIKNGLSTWKRSLTKSNQYQWKTSGATDGETMGKIGWLGVNVRSFDHIEASLTMRFLMNSLFMR